MELYSGRKCAHACSCRCPVRLVDCVVLDYLRFCSTQIIQALYKRYQKETMFIISDKSNEIYRAIRERTNHDATLFQGIGCYEEKQKTLIYSVINSEAKGSCFRLSVRLIPMLLSMLCGQKNLRGVFMIFRMIKSFMQIQSHK